MPETPEAPLHSLNPTERFSSRAADYTRYRPSYPAAAIDAILANLPTPATIADLGAGTGISSRLLADRGHHVLAVEPNAAMRDAAAPHPRITPVNATAEATWLPDASVDAVVSAQAFHWFRPIDAAREIARILRPRGRVALMWNVRNDGDPVTAAYSRVMDLASDGTSRDRGHFDRGTIDSLRVLTPLTLAEFPSSQSLDRDGLLGRALSASYFPSDGPRRARLIAELTSTFDRHARQGRIRLAYSTRVWLAAKV